MVGERSVRINQEGRIADDLSCRRCGYRLSGLRPDEQCPECATPIAKSLDLLRFADRAWVKRMARGLKLILFGLVATLLLALLAAAAGMLASRGFYVSRLEPERTIAVVIAVAITVRGIWLLTSPEPGVPPDPQAEPRVVARWLAFALLVEALLRAAWRFIPAGPWQTSRSVAIWIAMALALVAWAALFLHGRRLLLRVPAPRLAAQALIVMWGYLGSRVVLIGLTTSISLQMRANPGASMVPDRASVILGGFSSVCTMVFGIWALVLVVRMARLLNAAADACNLSPADP